jgi:hypothetical protein
MDVHTIVGFGIAVSMPVWLAVEEIIRRRRPRTMSRTARKTRIRGERQAVGSLERRVPAMSGEAVSRLSVAAGS